MHSYLAIEGDSEEGAKVPLSSCHDFHYPLERHMKLPIHVPHLFKVSSFLIEWLQQFEDFCNYFISFSLLEVVDAALQHGD